MNAYYHVRYWWHVLLRKLRIAPFGRLAKEYCTIDEIIAEWERDPQIRLEMAEARAEIKHILARDTEEWIRHNT